MFILGVFLLSLPCIVVFIINVRLLGVKYTLLAVALVISILSSITIGAYLVTPYLKNNKLCQIIDLK